MGSHPDDSFGIRLDRRNGVARLALRGELDIATAPELEQRLTLLEQDDIRAVLLDLRDLTFVDCAGLHAFMKAKSRAEENGHRFALVGASGQFRRILEVIALEGVLDEQEGLRLLALFAPGSSAGPRTSVGTEGNRDD